MSNKMKYLFILIFVIIAFAAGFTFTVQEGSGVVVSRFGRIVDVHTEAGLQLRLPWPIDSIITYDTRSQYMDSGHIETLTNDMINVILQTYIIWRIEDLELFHVSVGDYLLAQRHLNNLVANTINGVLGNYQFTSLISTNSDDIMLDEIRTMIEVTVAEVAIHNFGIEIQTVGIKRIALPTTNINSIFEQMIADRHRYVAGYLAIGERDAAIIVSEAQAMAAEIIAQGMLEASEIDAETERLIAEIYADAYSMNPELFTFLMSLLALENSVNDDTILIMRASETPFGIITEASGVCE